jgi:hypothetical protein
MENVRDHPCRLATEGNASRTVSNGLHNARTKYRINKNGSSQCNAIQVTVSMPIVTPNDGRQGLCTPARVMSRCHNALAD